MTDLSHLCGNAPVDLNQLWVRLRKMSGAELLRLGKAAKHMCSPTANLGKPPRAEFVIQLEEVREEWKRRSP